MYSNFNIVVKPYDLATIYAISDKNPQFLEKLLLVFTENISTDLELINQAANNGDLDEVSQLAHKMKTSLGHFGVASLKDVMISLEHPQSYNLNHLDYLLSELNKVISEVLSGLKEEFPMVFKK